MAATIYVVILGADQITIETCRNPFTNIETKAITLNVDITTSGVFGSEEGLEQILPVFFIDSHALILDLDVVISNLVSVEILWNGLLNLNRDFVACLRKLDRVLQQVYQNLLRS